MTDLLYRLCNQNQWFTNGDTRQYNEMFDYAKKHPSDTHGIACMIKICSVTNMSVEEVEMIIRRAEYAYNLLFN
jgi:hypothetical protein